MRDVPIAPDQVRDPFEKNVPGLGLGRDPVRTPMQWTGTESAGFTSGTPWLPLADDFKTMNVARLKQETASILNLYHRLIELRRKEPALSVGDYAALPAGDDLMTYIRKSAERRFLIALNFAGQSRSLNLGELQARAASLRISTYLDREHERLENELVLRADEGVIVELV